MQLQKQCPYMNSLIADFQKSTISGEIWSHSPPNYPFTICMHLVVMSTHLWSHQQILLGNKLIQCSYATALTTIKPCLGCGRNFIGHSCISFDHLTTVDNFLHCSIATANNACCNTHYKGWYYISEYIEIARSFCQHAAFFMLHNFFHERYAFLYLTLHK